MTEQEIEDILTIYMPYPPLKGMPYKQEDLWNDRDWAIKQIKAAIMRRMKWEAENE